ncbi:hypothetical protein CYMTET_29424, partial [Cymbomonas tetramitiformis]
DPAINVAAEAATWSGAAKAPELPGHKRDAIHRRVALWIARRKRPQSICETDTELRDIFDFVLNGSYTLPTYKLVQQNILKLSAEGRAKFKALQAELKADGVLPSISGDIYLVRHTGAEILLATKKVLADMLIGEYVVDTKDEGKIVKDTVTDNVHCIVSDNASNIVSGWQPFDGNECNCHTLALIVLLYLRSPGIAPTFKKLRGMTTHFNHSVIGAKLLNACQRKEGLSMTHPPQDNDTRSGWGGAYKQCSWYAEQRVRVISLMSVNFTLPSISTSIWTAYAYDADVFKVRSIAASPIDGDCMQTAIERYDIESPRKAVNAAANPDGSVYKDYSMTSDDWEIVQKSVPLLLLFYNAVQTTQETLKPTVSLMILHLIGALAECLDPSKPLMIGNMEITDLPEAVKTGRQVVYDNLQRRYFENLMECKLEDWVVATVLDPRYKSLLFKGLEKWNDGELLILSVHAPARTNSMSSPEHAPARTWILLLPMHSCTPRLALPQ